MHDYDIESRDPRTFRLADDDVGEVDYVAWLIRVVTWDVGLAMVILLAPTAIALAVPGQRGMIEVTSLVLPVVAFFVRAKAGNDQIGSNHCGTWVRLFQRIVFTGGILVLALLDCFMILSHIMPQGAFGPTDLLIGGALYGTYLLTMAIAMYPGRTPYSFTRDMQAYARM